MTYDRDFFGRFSILQLFKKRLAGLRDGYRQNIALVGGRYLGKSAVLKHFLANLDEKDVTAIYLDLEHKDFYYFFSKFTGSLLYNFSRNKGLPLHDDLNLLLENTKALIPHTGAVIRKIQSDVETGKHANAFLGLLTLPEVFTNETGEFCLLVFDEFQHLEDLEIAQAFRSLGKKIMTQKRCLYILSSSYPQQAAKIIAEKLSLLFGNFETISVEPFDTIKGNEFISYCLGDLRIGEQLKNFLTDFTGGHPLYLQLICQEMRNLSAVYNQNEIYLPLLSKTLETMIFNPWGVLSRHFDLVINALCAGKSGVRQVCAVLMAVANGKNKVAELETVLSLKKTAITQRLNRLVEAEVLFKNGNFYCFTDKLFKYWVKYVYQKRVRDVELAPDKQCKEFKDEFARAVEEFKINARKDFSSRVLELLHCFDNESFQLNGRKYKLPVFSQIVPIQIHNELGASCEAFKAMTKNAVWVIAAKKERFGEREINAILSECRHIGTKPEQCLIVSLSDLDEHVRLKALQERFWIWNEQELKTLVTVFNKPNIVR